MEFSVKGKNILVYDYGLFLVHALALAHAGAHVFYFTPWSTAYSQFEAYAPGLGYEDEGLEKVLYFWNYVDKADMFYFPDVGPGDLAQYLRVKTGKPVFGSALNYEGGDRLEQKRFFMRKLQKEIGLPTQETVRVMGIKSLREYLKKHDNKFVKLDKFRNDMESFHSKNYEEVELYLNEIEVALGPFSETYEFVIEDFVEGVEPGFDCFFNGTDWVKPYLWGIEQSKACYLGKFVDKLPPPLQMIADKYKPLLQKIGYRGAISTEARVTKDGTPYLIDTCSRYPSPLSNAYPLAIKNYAEVVWKVAAGEPVTIQTNGTYVGAAPLAAEHAKQHFVKLDFPLDLLKSNNVTLKVSAKIKDKYYGVKGTDVVFVICQSGNDYNKIITDIEQFAKKCDSFGLDLDPISGMFKIQELLDRYKEYKMGTF